MDPLFFRLMIPSVCVLVLVSPLLDPDLKER